jgi:hypothetical protein
MGRSGVFKGYIIINTVHNEPCHVMWHPYEGMAKQVPIVDLGRVTILPTREEAERVIKAAEITISSTYAKFKIKRIAY